jgi:hypothetical protein
LSSTNTVIEHNKQRASIIVLHDFIKFENKFSCTIRNIIEKENKQQIHEMSFDDELPDVSFSDIGSSDAGKKEDDNNKSIDENGTPNVIDCCALEKRKETKTSRMIVFFFLQK